ncbi:hypothetical protein ACFVMC_16495 [Nocardia sp. NPDC127579]|uniref:hypothetical protein n=1 Tax=Nocardia sp. NPDC127579 TaxID=3345402 RepID=UPI003624D1C4
MSSYLPYKLFLPHSTPSVHRVFAVYQDQGWDELKAVATFDDRASAVRLADALNELLSGAEAGPEFVAEALEAAPRPVRAQVERIAHRIESSFVHTDYLNALARPAICGVMRFPLTPEEPDDPIITPRTAETLRNQGELFVEELMALLDGDGSRRELPPALQRQKAPFLNQFVASFEHLLQSLDSGAWPEPRCPAEEIALWIMLERAAAQVEDERAGFAANTSQSIADLPKSDYDYNFDDLGESLFPDQRFRETVDHPTPFENGTLKHLFKPFTPEPTRRERRG